MLREKVKVNLSNCSNCYRACNSCVILDDLVITTTQDATIRELANIVSLYIGLSPNFVVSLIFDSLRNYQKINNVWACSIFHLEVNEKKKVAFEMFSELALKLNDYGIHPKQIELSISAISGFYTDVYCYPVADYIQD